MIGGIIRPFTLRQPCRLPYQQEQIIAYNRKHNWRNLRLFQHIDRQHRHLRHIQHLLCTTVRPVDSHGKHNKLNHRQFIHRRVITNSPPCHRLIMAITEHLSITVTTRTRIPKEITLRIRVEVSTNNITKREEREVAREAVHAVDARHLPNLIAHHDLLRQCVQASRLSLRPRRHHPNVMHIDTIAIHAIIVTTIVELRTDRVRAHQVGQLADQPLHRLQPRLLAHRDRHRPLLMTDVTIDIITNRNRAIKSPKSQAKSRCHQTRSPNTRTRKARSMPKETRPIPNDTNHQVIERTSKSKQKSQKGQNTKPKRTRIVRQVDLEETVEVNLNNQLLSR